MYDVARGLADVGHQVTVLAVNTPKHRQDDPTVLGPDIRLLTHFIDTSVRPGPALRNVVAQVRGAAGHLPYNVSRFVDAGFRARLAALLTAETFDIIQFEGTFVAAYAADCRRLAPHTPRVLRAHNLECQIWERLAENARNPLKRWYLRHLAEGLRAFETAVATDFDAIAAITELDAAQWAGLSKATSHEQQATRNEQRATSNEQPKTTTIPAGVRRTGWQPDSAIQPLPHAVGLIGALNWAPNVEGLRWLLADVWPLVRAARPDAELHIAGSHTPAWLTALRVPGVTIHGFVPSAAAFMQRHQLVLVPLLSGGGMRIKIIEAMTLGCAVLTTPVGGEGIPATHGREWLMAATPAEWVQAVLGALDGTTDVPALGRAAAALAAREFDNEAVVRRFEALYAQLLVGAPATTPPPHHPTTLPR